MEVKLPALQGNYDKQPDRPTDQPTDGQTGSYGSFTSNKQKISGVFYQESFDLTDE